MTTELANLRARSRWHLGLKQAEDLAQPCRDKLADLEARMVLMISQLPSYRNFEYGQALADRQRP